MSKPLEKNDKPKSTTGLLATFFNVLPTAFIQKDETAFVIPTHAEKSKPEQIFDLVDDGLKLMNHDDGNLTEAITALLNACENIRDYGTMPDEVRLIGINKQLQNALQQDPLKNNKELKQIQEQFSHKCKEFGFTEVAQTVVKQEKRIIPNM